MSDDVERGAAAVVFDPRAVASLTGDAADPDFAVVFVSAYRRLLPARIERILATLRTGDLDDVLDAVLSLKVSSCTLGAGELQQLGADLEGRVRLGDLPGALAAAQALPAAAERADAALGSFLAA